MTNTITNSDDLIDIRSVIERYEELESRGPFYVWVDESCDNVTESLEEAHKWATEFSEDPEREHVYIADADNDVLNAAEVHQLVSLLSELKGNGGDEQWRGDWYPVTLIRDSYFKDYAQELADELGYMDKEQQWPFTCIDWDQAARELRMDYSSVEFDGVTYWYR